MGVRQYQLGKAHGLAGIRQLAHRNGRLYDSKSAQRSYVNGYQEGYRERPKTGKALEYNSPLNNQLFKEA